MSHNRKKENPSVVCIGGGTGLSTMLRGLKNVFSDVTAIVTMADDGGGSGVLRRELDMPPPGDLRNCIIALSDTEDLLRDVMNYRFHDGSLRGQSLGNLFLAALTDLNGGIDAAAEKMCRILHSRGRVLPVTGEKVTIVAELEDGSSVAGESHIFAAKKERNCRIKNVRMEPPDAPALPKCVGAIERADLLILGPGSLYTSIIPNLLTEGIPDAIRRSRAMKLYICNVMTQDGETENYTVSDHVRALFDHAGGPIFDKCLANTLPAPEALLKKYAAEDAGQLFADEEELEKLGVAVYTAPLASAETGYYRHDPEALAREILRIYREE